MFKMDDLDFEMDCKCNQLLSDEDIAMIGIIAESIDRVLLAEGCPECTSAILTELFFKALKIGREDGLLEVKDFIENI